MLAKKEGKIPVETYLETELNSEIKHEYVDGYILAMVGSSDNHDYISGNIYRKFGNHLEHSPCRPFTSDKKLKTSKGNFRYPDCMVVCDDDNEDLYYKTSPVILVEVISRSTQKIDKKNKFLEYINISSLMEYILIEQDFVDITVCRKKDGWRSVHYFLGESIIIESIGLSVTVEAIYQRVDNQDMMEFLATKNGY